MFNHRFDETPNNIVVFHWFMLSFNGGCINAGGFMATGKFVSHVTGFATLFGVDLTTSDVHTALGILSVPIFFLFGAFLAGLLIDRPVYNKKRPHFDWVMLLSAFCLFGAAIGRAPSFGTFGEAIKIEDSYFLLALLCLSSGLQNAAITSSSGRSIRTTHLTGLTTDLGIGLARILTFGLKSDKYSKESRVNKLRIGSITAFVFGSAVGAWIFMKFEYGGFILPGVISVYAAWHGRKAKLKDHIWNPVT